MEAIFSSKLYKTSRRKDKIASAINNPINAELVQQLDNYLTDVPDYMKEDSKVSKVPESSNPSPSVSTTPETTFTRPEGSSRPEGKRFGNSPEPSLNESSFPETDDMDKPVEVDVEDPELQDRSPETVFHAPGSLAEDNDNSGEIEESQAINSATALYQPPVAASCCDKARLDAAAIKGTLNVRDDTKGVSRIQVKDKELWIYYNDKINLNSVMEPVIDVLNSTGFTNLEFNRLARTENAIVFEISCIYDDVKPVKDEE